MNQKKLSEALHGVVEDSVNKVGVDLNTASASLLEYVSGVSKAVARNMIDYFRVKHFARLVHHRQFTAVLSVRRTGEKGCRPQDACPEPRGE